MTSPFKAASLSLIAVLLFVSCPAAIVWRIWTVVIDSIKRQANRPRPHVSEERGKTIAPSFANKYSSATIAVESGVSRISTALFHGVPEVIFWAASQTMPQIRCARAFLLQTTATLSWSFTTQSTAFDNGFNTTIASASPKSSFAKWFGLRYFVDYGQSADARASHVDLFHGAALYTLRWCEHHG